MWNKSAQLGLGIALTCCVLLIRILATQNAIGQSGTRIGGGGFSGGGAPTAGGGSGGPGIDPLGLAQNLILSGQAGGDSDNGERGVVLIAERLAQYLVAAQYSNWAPAPGQMDDFSKGRGPHGAFVKTFVNRNVVANPKTPGYGSILLQENYGKDKKKLLDVTVMCRIQGFDPVHDDWFWAQYLPNGAIARAGQAKLAGQAPTCINCHSRADGRDYVYSNK